VKECDYDEVVIELVLFFAVEEKVIWDKVKEFEAAIAEAGRVDASKVKIKAVKPILASRRATGSEVTSEVTTTKANQAAVKADLNLDNINKALVAKGLPTAAKDANAVRATLSSKQTRNNRDVIIAVVVACVGGGAIVIAIAAYYTYFVKKPAETTTSGRELEEAAPVVAPAATLGMPSPMIFDAADFEAWTKREQMRTQNT